MAAVLPTRALGSTGMGITKVGFGAWAVGGGRWSFGWGPQDDAASIAAIRHAVELGVNWIDTAAAYGLGHSEEIVAAALEGSAPADRPFVFTKCGNVSDPRDPMALPRRLGDPASVRREVEASLRRLRVERIDLLQMHWPAEDGTPLEAYWEVFCELREAGVIAAAGLSNHGVALLEQAEALGHVDSVQPPYSLIKRRAGADVIPWCAAHGAGVIVYSPMQSGLLSGTFERGARRGARPRGLASQEPGLLRRRAGEESCPRRGVGADRRAPRHLRGGRRRGLDARDAGGLRCHRRGSQPIPGRRLVGGRGPHP